MKKPMKKVSIDEAIRILTEQEAQEKRDAIKERGRIKYLKRVNRNR